MGIKASEMRKRSKNYESHCVSSSVCKMNDEVQKLLQIATSDMKDVTLRMSEFSFNSSDIKTKAIKTLTKQLEADGFEISYHYSTEIHNQYDYLTISWENA